MKEPLMILIAFMGGLALGMLFYVALVLVMRQWNRKGFALKYFLFYLVRVFLLLTGFYFLTDGSWKRLLAVAVGFTLSRFISQRKFRFTSVPDKQTA